MIMYDYLYCIKHCMSMRNWFYAVFKSRDVSSPTAVLPVVTHSCTFLFFKHTIIMCLLFIITCKYL